MAHKPTFKVSSRQRPVRQRMTPLGWAMVFVVVLVVGLGAALALMAGRGDRDRGAAWEPTPTTNPPPVEEPPPTLAPTPRPSPTVWYAEMVTPTVAPTAVPDPTPAFPAWWAGEMTQDDEGRWWPPDEVIEMVAEQYRAAWDEYRSHAPENAPADLDGLEASIRSWHSGPSLESQLVGLEAMRDGQPVYTSRKDECLYEVQEWSADGLEATLGSACQGVTLTGRDPETGEILSETYREHGGLLLIRMVYDPATGRWMQNELVDYFPVGE